MEIFLRRYKFEILLPVFKEAGIGDDEFYALSNNEMCTYIKNYEIDLIDFISKYNFEKGLLLNSSNSDFVLDEVHNDHEHVKTYNLNIVTENKMNNIIDLSTISDPQNHNNVSEFQLTPKPSSKDICFKENDLFHLLNKDLDGKALLRIYQIHKEIDRALLKHKIIYNELNKNEISYKIKPEVFKKLRGEVIELFPSEDPDFYYVEAYVDDDKQSVGARGCLYNYYKEARGYLRKAELLIKRKDKQNDSGVSDKCNEDTNADLDCLTQFDPRKHKITETLKYWEDSYADRMKLLIKKERKTKITTLDKYFRTFTCLTPPHAVLLLEQDSYNSIVDLSEKCLVPKDSLDAYTLMFTVQWPHIAEKIIIHCKKLKVVEVNRFLQEHRELITKGTHNSTLALFLIPYCIKAIKNCKVGDVSVNLTKHQMSKCFILHIEDLDKVEEEKQNFEDWLMSLNQQIHPYILCAGNLENLQTSLILNGEKYVYENPVKAVEACYKCLTALKAFPTFCDFIWGFIDKYVYNFSFKKVNAYVTKLGSDLNNQK